MKKLTLTLLAFIPILAFAQGRRTVMHTRQQSSNNIDIENKKLEIYKPTNAVKTNNINSFSGNNAPGVSAGTTTITYTVRNNTSNSLPGTTYGGNGRSTIASAKQGVTGGTVAADQTLRANRNNGQYH